MTAGWSAYQEASSFGRDPRVLWTQDDRVPAQIPSWSNYAERNVQVADGRVFVDGVTDGENGDLWPFATLDEALTAALGSPIRSMLTRDEYLAAVNEGMPADAMHVCTMRLVRHGSQLAEAVGSVLWTGGFALLHRWAADLEGLASAGQWAVDHEAVWAHNNFRIASVEDLTIHFGW